MLQYSKCDPILLTKIFLKIDASDKAHFEVFPKEKGGIFIMSCFALVMLSLSCHALAMLCFDLAMFLLIKFAPKTKIFSSTIDSPRFGDKKEKFTIHLSLFTITIHPLLFMTLFTPNFFLFKGGCPLCLKQVLVKFYFRSSSLERVPSSELIVSLSLREFLTTIPISLQNL